MKKLILVLLLLLVAVMHAQKTAYVKFVISPPQAMASLTGKGINGLQWSGTNVFESIPAGSYTLRLRMENARSLDTIIIINENSAFEIDIIVHEDRCDFKTRELQEKEIIEPNTLNGKEWQYSFIFPGVGQILQKRTMVGSMIFALESAAIIYYSLAVKKYNPKRLEYQKVIDTYRNTALNSELDIVLAKKASVQGYYNNALLALIGVSAIYVASVVDAYDSQLLTNERRIHFYSGIMPEKSGVNCSFGMRVQL